MLPEHTELVSLLWTAKNRSALMANLVQFEENLRDKEIIAECRIAILSGSTTSLIARLLKVFLLDKGIKTSIMEGHFGNYFLDARNPSADLINFNPQIVYIHTSRVNLDSFGNLRSFAIHDCENSLIDNEILKISTNWKSICAQFDCWIIQNNFDLSPELSLGNSEGSEEYGRSFVVNEINRQLVVESKKFDQVLVHDINYLSASIGLGEWWSSRDWIQYGLAISTLAHPSLGFSLASVINAVLGESKKCLVLDFDNTLWGGVIGEVGVTGIELGPDSSRGKAFVDFQLTLKDLASRGVLLAGCTKNNISSALAGLNHSNSLLTPEDFMMIEASWDPKPIALKRIIDSLNFGERAVVFVDDSEVEVHAVRTEFPEVSVVLLDSRFPEEYSNYILRPRYFESIKLTREDISRNGAHARSGLNNFRETDTYDHVQFLRSLNAVATISSPTTDQLERVIQLINKTNQFNVNGVRRTLSEVKRLVEDPSYLVLVGEFKDDITNYGLTTVIGGRFVEDSLIVDIWVMSCRTFDRHLENAMLLVLERQMETRVAKNLKLDFKRTSRNQFFIDRGATLGLFSNSIKDGIITANTSAFDNADEITSKVVFVS